MTDGSNCLLVIRLRGSAGLPREIKDTLNMLNLRRANWATLVPDNPSIKGMLRKVSHYITWGEPEPEQLARAFSKRGELLYGLSLEEGLRRLKVNSVEELAEKLCKGELSVREFKKVFKPYIRLHPPKGGFKKSIKRPFNDGGEYGYRGKAINDLLKRMI